MAADAGYARPSTALEGDVIRTSEASADRTRRSTVADSPETSRQCADCSPTFSNRTYEATKVYNTEILESGRLLAAGGVAGAVSKTCTAPLARLTILYQARRLPLRSVPLLACICLSVAIADPRQLVSLVSVHLACFARAITDMWQPMSMCR